MAKPRPKKAAGSGVVESFVHGASPEPMGRAFSAPDLIERIQAGLPIRELDDLVQHLHLSRDKLARKLGISKATLQRRIAAGRLDATESDRVVRLARLMGNAARVFGNEDDAKSWLSSPQFGLGGAVPLDYSETEAGAREVENLLGRIEHGVYS